MKGRSDHREYFEPAPGAFKSRMPLDAMELPVLAAFRTIQLFAVAGAHQVAKAGIVVWKALEKVPNTQRLTHNFLHSMRNIVVYGITGVKGIMAFF
jgi:hypothetical protein